VFVQVDHSGVLTPEKPMSIGSLNQKLQQLCTGVGLLERNSYYSLRRTAIIEVKKRHCTEKATQIAFHVASGCSLLHYDNVGFGDTDMQSFRLGGPEIMTKGEVRSFFPQSNISRWTPKEGDEPTLLETIWRQVKARLPLDAAYVAMQEELQTLYGEAKTMLDELQAAGVIPVTDRIPHGNSVNDGAVYRSVLQRYNCHELVAQVDNLLAARKALHQKIRRSLRKTIIEELKADHEALLVPDTKTGLSCDDGILVDQGDDQEDEDKDQEDDDVDQATRDASDALDEELDCWDELQGTVHVQVRSGTVTQETMKVRRDFLLQWLDLKDSIVAQADLTCPRCKVDPTITQADKERRYNLFRLNTHMRGSTHSRESQIRRTLKQDGYTDNTTWVQCPICAYKYKGIRRFISHMKAEHEEHLWDDIEDESEYLDDEIENFDDAGENVDDEGENFDDAGGNFDDEYEDYDNEDEHFNNMSEYFEEECEFEDVPTDEEWDLRS
jgi:hypothetical protein